ncbi:hypothetical protein Alg130_10643 [Pyrenophora tritici-repentis]|nr:hypothetical protein Alg130_10643 [Pyrenophora tritici-repentis]
MSAGTDDSMGGGIDLGVPEEEHDWTILPMSKIDTVTVQRFNAAPKTNAFWLQFPGFATNPAARFLHEFESLASRMAWSKKERHKKLAEALAGEIDFHGDKSSGLVRWQRLCREVGVGSDPESITKCKKVLEAHFVNLYSLVDHRRNPEFPVVHFTSFKELRQDIHRTGTFPRQM